MNRGNVHIAQRCSLVLNRCVKRVAPCGSVNIVHFQRQCRAMTSPPTDVSEHFNSLQYAGNKKPWHANVRPALTAAFVAIFHAGRLVTGTSVASTAPTTMTASIAAVAALLRIASITSRSDWRDGTLGAIRWADDMTARDAAAALLLDSAATICAVADAARASIEAGSPGWTPHLLVTMVSAGHTVLATAHDVATVTVSGSGGGDVRDAIGGRCARELRTLRDEQARRAPRGVEGEALSTTSVPRVTTKARGPRIGDGAQHAVLAMEVAIGALVRSAAQRLSGRAEARDGAALDAALVAVGHVSVPSVDEIPTARGALPERTNAPHVSLSDGAEALTALSSIPGALASPVDRLLICAATDAAAALGLVAGVTASAASSAPSDAAVAHLAAVAHATARTLRRRSDKAATLAPVLRAQVSALANAMASPEADHRGGGVVRHRGDAQLRREHAAAAERAVIHPITAATAVYDCVASAAVMDATTGGSASAASHNIPGGTASALVGATAVWRPHIGLSGVFVDSARDIESINNPALSVPLSVLHAEARNHVRGWQLSVIVAAARLLGRSRAVAAAYARAVAPPPAVASPAATGSVVFVDAPLPAFGTLALLALHAVLAREITLRVVDFSASFPADWFSGAIGGASGARRVGSGPTSSRPPNAVAAASPTRSEQGAHAFSSTALDDLDAAGTAIAALRRMTARIDLRAMSALAVPSLAASGVHTTASAQGHACLTDVGKDARGPRDTSTKVAPSPAPVPALAVALLEMCGGIEVGAASSVPRSAVPALLLAQAGHCRLHFHASTSTVVQVDDSSASHAESAFGHSASSATATPRRRDAVIRPADVDDFPPQRLLALVTAFAPHTVTDQCSSSAPMSTNVALALRTTLATASAELTHWCAEAVVAAAVVGRSTVTTEAGMLTALSSAGVAHRGVVAAIARRLAAKAPSHVLQLLPVSSLVDSTWALCLQWEFLDGALSGLLAELQTRHAAWRAVSRRVEAAAAVDARRESIPTPATLVQDGRRPLLRAAWDAVARVATGGSPRGVAASSSSSSVLLRSIAPDPAWAIEARLYRDVGAPHAGRWDERTAMAAAADLPADDEEWAAQAGAGAAHGAAHDARVALPTSPFLSATHLTRLEAARTSIACLSPFPGLSQAVPDLANCSADDGDGDDAAGSIELGPRYDVATLCTAVTGILLVAARQAAQRAHGRLGELRRADEAVAAYAVQRGRSHAVPRGDESAGSLLPLLERPLSDPVVGEAFSRVAHWLARIDPPANDAFVKDAVAVNFNEHAVAGASATPLPFLRTDARALYGGVLRGICLLPPALSAARGTGEVPSPVSTAHGTDALLEAALARLGTAVARGDDSGADPTAWVTPWPPSGWNAALGMRLPSASRRWRHSSTASAAACGPPPLLCLPMHSVALDFAAPWTDVAVAPSLLRLQVDADGRYPARSGVDASSAPLQFPPLQRMWWSALLRSRGWALATLPLGALRWEELEVGVAGHAFPSYRLASTPAEVLSWLAVHLPPPLGERGAAPLDPQWTPGLAARPAWTRSAMRN